MGQTWKETSACIESIFSREAEAFELYSDRDLIEVYPGYVSYQTKSSEDVQVPKSDRAPRGKIRSFSRKSRGRMIKRMASLESHPDWWQDFTFPDDVMSWKTVEERAEYIAKVLKAVKRDMEALYPDLWGFWKKEWVPRKTGSLQGEECPHFHVMFGLPGVTEKTFRQVARRFARIWVQALGTDQAEKALAVAINDNSYRWLVSAKMAQIYVSKYIAKTEFHDDQYSRGRFWGIIGKPPFAEPVRIRLFKSEAAQLRRLFRRKVKRSSRQLARTFQQPRTTFILLQACTTLQALRWVFGETAPPF